MLLTPVSRKGSICLELLIYLPLIAGLFLLLILGQLFFLESLCGSVINEQTDMVLSSLWAIRMSGSPARKLVMSHDVSGYLVEDNMDQVSIARRDGMMQVLCRYKSSFLPDVYIESRAAERSWKP